MTKRCSCAVLADLEVEDMSLSASTRTHRVLAHRGSPWWWLHMSVCEACGQHWLVAQEERLNDIYVLRKIEAGTAEQVAAGGAWPADFDRYETLLRIGAQHGHAARFCEAESALPIAIDLVGQRPDIDAAEVAQLVNLPDDSALEITERARAEVALRGYPYPWQPA